MSKKLEIYLLLFATSCNLEVATWETRQNEGCQWLHFLTFIVSSYFESTIIQPHCRITSPGSSAVGHTIKHLFHIFWTLTNSFIYKNCKKFINSLVMVVRSLVMVAKCLQNLANLVEFGGKEPYMEVVNPFILKNKERMVVFLDHLSVSNIPFVCWIIL